MTATGWQAIADSVPDKSSEVLLLWSYPENDVQIIRMGRFFMTVYTRDGEPRPLFKIDMDFGDFGSWVYTDRDDPPMHWHVLPELPS